MIHIFEFEWSILEQVTENTSSAEDDDVVPSLPTLQFATEEEIPGESIVFLAQKPQEQAIVTTVEDFKVAEVNQTPVQEPKTVCIFKNVFVMFHLCFFRCIFLWISSFEGLMYWNDFKTY